jgi:hypothetical protein
MYDIFDSNGRLLGLYDPDEHMKRALLLNNFNPVMRVYEPPPFLAPDATLQSSIPCSEFVLVWCRSRLYYEGKNAGPLDEPFELTPRYCLIADSEPPGWMWKLPEFIRFDDDWIKRGRLA